MRYLLGLSCLGGCEESHSKHWTKLCHIVISLGNRAGSDRPRRSQAQLWLSQTGLNHRAICISHWEPGNRCFSHGEDGFVWSQPQLEMSPPCSLVWLLGGNDPPKSLPFSPFPPRSSWDLSRHGESSQKQIVAWVMLVYSRCLRTCHSVSLWENREVFGLIPKVTSYHQSDLGRSFNLSEPGFLHL